TNTKMMVFVTFKSRRLNMSENLSTIDLQITSPNEALALFGTNDKHLKQLEEQLHVTIVTRGEQVRVSGLTENIEMVQNILLTILSIVRKGLTITERDIVCAVELAKNGKINQLETLLEDEITKNAKGKSIRVKTLGQKNYVSQIKTKDL